MFTNGIDLRPTVYQRNGNVLFNDALNTFYLWLYGIHSDSERGNLLPPYRLLILIIKGYHPIDRITHITAFVTSVMGHWLEWEIAQWVHHEGLIQWPIANALTMELHLAPTVYQWVLHTTWLYSALNSICNPKENKCLALFLYSVLKISPQMASFIIFHFSQERIIHNG